MSHAHKTTPLILNNKVIIVFLGARDTVGITITTFIDLCIDNPSKILYVHSKPILDVGKIGAFVDSGASVSSVLRVGDYVYMYCIGGNPSATVHARNSIGLVVSKDNGLTFQRFYDGSVLDRNHFEPYYTGAVDVMLHDNNFLT